MQQRIINHVESDRHYLTYMESIAHEPETTPTDACRAALKKSLVADPDDLLVVTASLPFGTPGAANLIPVTGPSCWDGMCHIEE
jgi:hypothetical protein